MTASPASYEVSTLIHTDGRFSLYRARDAELRSFLLKTSHHAAAGPALVAFARDFRIARQHTGGHVLGAHRLQVLDDGSIAQVRADWVGFSLEELLAQRLPPGYALRLMQALLDAVDALHETGLLLRDLRPSNFLHDEDLKRVTLVDCSESVPLTEENSSPPSERSPYHAPEVADKTDWTPDRRSDFYGIGVLAYQALTGMVPSADLESRRRDDQAKARPIASGVPLPLSELVLKLLAKNPGDRYQTAAGLRADLSRCSEEWHAFGDITPFSLGSLEANRKLRFPPTLYGQGETRGALQHAFTLAANGHRQFVVLSGAAGAGKSALLRELQSVALSGEALVIGGKWDQFQREGAFTGLVRACADLVDNARALGTSERDELSRALSVGLAENAALLLELVPQLRDLVPSAPLDTQVGSAERQNRVAFCFTELFRALGGLSRPVLVCLEDLHWADSASHGVVSAIAGLPPESRLMTVVSYRSSPAAAAELEEFLAAARGRGGSVEHHRVSPLGRDEVAQLVCDTLSSDVTSCEPLSGVLWRLSQGNPFSLREILVYLQGQGTLIFDTKLARWVWDVDEIGPTAVPHDVADILVQRAQELSERHRLAIEAGACVGDRFDAATVAALVDDPTESVETALQRASDLGLVSSASSRERQQTTPSEFAFRHDRIRRAIYQATAPERRASFHSRLGERLLLRHRGEPFVGTLLEAVAHLNKVPGSLPNEPLAQLNLEAAVLAKRSSAHETAATLLRTAFEQMGASAWDLNRSLTFRIVVERAEAEYLADQPGVATELFEDALRRAQNDDERIEALQRRVQVRSNAGRFADAAADGVACLQLLGVRLPLKPKPYALLLPLLAVLLRHHLLRRKLQLGDTRLVRERDRRAIESLARLWGPAFWTDENLTGLVVLRLLRMSLDCGNTPASSIAYACYGVFLSEVMGRRKQGQSVCQLGWLLAKQAQHPMYMWRAKFMYLAFFAHYDAPLASSINEFRAALRGSMTAGDYPYAGSCANLILYILPAAGTPFVEAYREITVLAGLARQVEQDRAIVSVEILQRWMGILENKRPHDVAPRFTLDILGNDASQFSNERGCFYLFELPLLFLLGRYEDALAVSKELRGSKMLSGYFKAYYYFFYALSLSQAAGIGRKPPKRAFRKCLRLIEAHEACYAVNYRHKSLLLRALAGRGVLHATQTIAAFEAAARFAHEDGFPHHSAIAWELLAEFCEQQGDSRAALRHLANARLGYVEWGCLFKVEATDRAHARLAASLDFRRSAGEGSAIVSEELGKVLAAARALSGETDAERIMQKLLEGLLEHTGATRVLAAVAREQDLVVESEASFDDHGKIVHRVQSQLLTECSTAPQTLLSYTQRLGTSVSLDSEAQRTVFARDAYIAARPDHGLACVPLLWLNKCIGVLLLESRFDAKAFTPSKLAAAALLAGQGAATLRSAWEYRERLAVLQTRMNPHFLYNALNSIAEMTVTQPEAAEGAIVKLADLYRFLTAAPGSHLIRLREEVGFVRSYLQLEKLRYRERLSFDILVSGDLESSLIPPLLLQPLVENAVHHGVASRPEGGRVTLTVNVSEHRVHVRVADTGVGFERFSGTGTGTSTGIGMATTRSRLELCFGSESEMQILNEGGGIVQLSFPNRRLS